MLIANNPRRAQRLRLVASVMVMLASLAGIARAAEFDEKLKAPLMKDAATMKTQALSFSARFADLKEAGAEQLITNRVLAGERFDIAYQIQQAIDEGRPLGDVSALGLLSRGDGSYGIDLNLFPQWKQIDDQVTALLPHADWDALSQQLINRGMTSDAASTLRAYVDSHKVPAAIGASTQPISLSFGKLIKKYDKLKQPVPGSVVLSYVYQRARAAAEVKRAWAEGLLKSVDSHSSRILLSMLNEGQASAIWSPSAQDAGIADILATVRRPDYEQLVITQSTGEAP